MIREGRVIISSASRPAFGSGYYITAYEPGAQVAQGSASTTVTVRAGHGLATDDYVMVCSSSSVDTNRVRKVMSVTATTVLLDSAMAVASGEFLCNLGPDSGQELPVYDGSGVVIYHDMDYTTAANDSTVIADTTGRYRYFHQSVAIWELIRTSTGTPVALYIDTGEVDAAQFGVNVADYGATGDGSTDDTVAIQAAVDARSTANGVVVGGTIWFPAGIYTVSAPINMTSGIILRGESTQSTRIQASASFSGTEILRWDGTSGIGQNPGVGARDIYLDCNGVDANGIQVFKGYDGVHFDNVMVDNVGISNNGWRFEEDPDYGNSVSQTILLSNCYGIHEAVAGATGEVFYFNSVQEMTLVNCKGFGGYAVAAGNCDVFHFDGCRGVTMLGGAAAISQANGIKIKSTARASQGLAFYGVTFEALTDSIDAEGNVFVINYLTVIGSRLQHSSGTTPVIDPTGGFNLQNVDYATFDANTGFTLSIDSNCTKINVHTDLYANILNDDGDGTKLIADHHADTGNTYSVFGQGINIMVPDGNATGPEIHWGHNAVADYWRMFWSRSSSVNNGFFLRYVSTGAVSSNVMKVDSDLDPIRFYAADTEMLNVTASGVTSLGHLQGLKATEALTSSAAITTAARFLIDITNTSGTNTPTLVAPSSVDGKVLILRCAALTAGTITLADSGTCALSAAWVPDAGDTLTLVASGSIWYEIARSAN